MTTEVFDESSIDLSHLDFGDLEEKFQVEEPQLPTDSFVVVDGAPIAPESKAPVLKKVLAKLFGGCGKIVDMILPVEDGKTKGYLIIKYSEPLEAFKAVKTLHGKKLDVKHRLLVNRLNDIEKFVLSGEIGDEFKAPVIPEFKNVGYLNSWLLDPNGRDQFLLNSQKSDGIYWFKKNINKEEVIEPRQNWTSSFMKWSPKGQYLFSTFPNGVQSWGGDQFVRINKFIHPNIEKIDISPNEKFLITYSPEPLADPNDLKPEIRESYPFKSEDAGKKLVIWDIVTGWPVKTFAVPQQMENEWPLVKWSFDENYCARLGPDAIAVYDTKNNFDLLDKKLVKIEGVADFEFAPSGIKTPLLKKGDPLEVMLAYWIPESENQSAKVSVMTLPQKQVLRTAPLVQVVDCKLYWQKSGKYLCCRVNRHTKSRKTVFTNLEIFQVTEKDIPIEKIELQEVVSEFSWEPKGNKFGFISKKDRTDTSNVQLGTSTKHMLTFYSIEEVKVGIGKNANVMRKWVKSASFDDKDINIISWSPTGRYAVSGCIGKVQSTLEFYDCEFENEKEKVKEVKLLSSEEFGGLSGLQWENSGRSIAAWSSTRVSPVNNGYTIYDFVGHVTRTESIDQFYDFQWRPRPDSLLSINDKKRVRKQLTEHSAKFEELDNMESNAELRELILKRKKMLKEWSDWESSLISKMTKLGFVEKEEVIEMTVIQEVNEVVIEEKEEEVDE